MKIILILLLISSVIVAKDNISGYFQVYDYIDLTGFLDETNFFTNKHPRESLFSHDRTGLKLQLRFNGDIIEDLYYDVSVNIDYDSKLAQKEPTSNNDDGVVLSFREGFIVIRDVMGFLDIKVGRQYLFWGGFEWGSALDVITPWNFNTMSAEKENFRIAVDMLKLTFNISDSLTLDTIFIPIAPENRVAIPDKMGTLTQKDSIHPSKDLLNSEIAFKLTWQAGEETEISLDYFKGFDRNFSIMVDIDNSEFWAEYRALQVVGLELSTISFNTMWIFEVAYHHTDDKNGDNISITNRNISSVFGFEKDITSNLSLSGQISFKKLFDYDRQKEYESFSGIREDPYVKRTESISLLYRLRYIYSPKVSFQILNSIDLRDFNMMLLTFASINPMDKLKLYVGTILFKGVEGSRFGRVEEESRFFIELKYLF